MLNHPRVPSGIKLVTHSHMAGRLHYYVLVCFRSPITQWSDGIIHPVPNAHLDTCTSGRVRTCGKITIKFPDCHYHGGLLTVCDTVCHPVTPPKCPDSSGFGYSRSDKDGGGRVLLAGSCLSTIFRFFGRKIHVQTNMASCVLGNKKFDCNLLNNRFLKKKSAAMGNGIETSELL